MKAALSAALVLACSCAGGNATVAMHPVEAIRVDPVAGEGVVVFVRPAHACEGAGSITIVDELGDYLGETPPTSQFAVALAEGDHTLYAWDPHVVLRGGREVNDVAVAQVHVESRHPAYVRVSNAGSGHELRKTCGAGWPHMTVVGKNNGELDDWLRETKPYAADRAAGQKWAQSNAAEVQRRIALGERERAEQEERAKSSPAVPTSGPAPSP